MTTEEFSNTFDTMLSSYLHDALFGDLSSYADVTLDEYEKSTFLTLAQDLIVKTYFEKTLNASGEGFDDSAKRLMDYANLITTATFNVVKSDSNEAFSENGIMIDFNTNNDENNAFGEPYIYNNQKYYKTPLFIINERVVAGGKNSIVYTELPYGDIQQLEVGDTVYKLVDNEYVQISINDSTTLETIKSADYSIYRRSILLVDTRSYVIVPINYQEYDRMMSKAYCEPLKRLAWRLFETDRATLNCSSELILRSDAGAFRKYVVRYIRRPRPIVLVDLSNTDNDLSIDGVLKKTECELNPIIHNEILTLAVLMALASRGIETRDTKAAKQSNSNS